MSCLIPTESKIKEKCCDRDKFKEYLSIHDINYLNQNIQEISNIIYNSCTKNAIIKVKLRSALNVKEVNKQEIENYVKSIISEVGELSPASESIDGEVLDGKLHNANLEDYQEDKSDNIDKLLHGEEKNQFINHAKTLVISSLYIREDVGLSNELEKYFVSTKKDISDSLKMLQKDLVFELREKYDIADVTNTQEETLLSLYKNKNSFTGKDKWTYLLLVNFDNFISELTNGLVSTENESDIYLNDDIKYKFDNKLDVIKNFGDDAPKVQINAGISSYITNLTTENGVHLNMTGFQIAFKHILSTFKNVNNPDITNLSKVYENVNYFENIIESSVNELASRLSSNEQKNLKVVYENVFKESNPDSLINIHKRTQLRYPNVTSDLYTMLCNTMNNSLVANYTSVEYDENAKTYMAKELKQNTINQHKLSIEENIVSSLTKMSSEEYLNKYFESDHRSNGLLELKSKEGAINGGIIKIKYDKNSKTPIIYLEKSANDIIKLTDEKMNSESLQFINNNNNKFVKDTLLMNLNEYKDAFDSVANNGGSREILQFIGASALVRAFKYEYNDLSVDQLNDLASKEFPGKDNTYAFSEISNIYKPGGLALNGLDRLADMYGIIFGDGNRSYVKNPEGNNMPVFKNFSLITNPDLHFDTLKQSKPSTFEHNLFNNPNLKWESATMTSVTVIDPETGEKIPKPITDLSRSELFYNSFIYNYLLPNSVGFQPVVYSDKGSIANIWTNKETLVKEITDEYTGDPSLSFSEKITQSYYNRNRKIANSLAKNILNDIYRLEGDNTLVDDLLPNEVYSKLVDSYKKLSTDWNLSKIRERVKELSDIEWIEEIHCSFDKKGNVMINPTLMHFFQMFISNEGNNPSKSFLEKINIQKALAVHDLNKDNFVLRKTNNKGKTILELDNWSNKKDNWYDKKLEEYKLFNIESSDIPFTVQNILTNKITPFTIHPKLDEFLLLDMFISDHFNLSTIGNAFIHSSKIKLADSANLLESFTKANVPFHRINSYESTQTIAMYKRAVGFTANMFTLAKGLNHGIPNDLKYAILDDPQEMVINAQNTSDVVDIHDGSIFFSSLVNDMISTSLGELNVNKKHFKPFILLNHPEYCTSTEIKSAGFVINNYSMREGINSSEKYTTIFKKTHNLPFDSDFKLNVIGSDFEGAMYLTKVEGTNITKQARIKKVEFLDGNNRNIKVTRELSDNFDDQTIKPTIDELNYEINSVYDLWKMLGGAYSYKDGSFNEESLSRISNLFGNTPKLKDYIIHFVAKVSACKTGITNRNGRESLKDLDTNFSYFSSPSHYFGMQLDASHGIDGGDVTGSVQHISSLIQGGYTAEEALETYHAIGKLITENIEGLNFSSIGIDDPQKEKELLTTLSKFVISNIETRANDVGLTEAIVKFAKEQNNSVIPFDDPNIINLFTSVLNSVVTKNIIKRTSAGIPAVQSPTSELVTVYEDPDGNVFSNSEIYKNNIELRNIEGISKSNLHSIKPGDVILYQGVETLVSGYNKKIKTGIVHQYPVIGLEELRKIDLSKETITKLNSKGRNLRGQNINITLDNGSIVDLFDLDVSKLSYYLEDVKGDSETGYIFSDDKDTNDTLLVVYANFINSLNEIDKSLQGKFKATLKNYLLAKNKSRDGNVIQTANASKYWNQVSEILNNVLQNDLKNIKNGQFKLGNEFVNIKEYKVNDAECILGNAYASKFGLKQGDFLGDIINKGTEFFKNKLDIIYSINDEQYDFTLSSLSNPKIYVKVVTELNPNIKDKFKKVTRDDGKRFIADSNGNLIIPYDQNTMQIAEENGKYIVYTLEGGLKTLDEPSLFGFIKPNSENLFNEFLSTSKILEKNFNKNEYLTNGLFNLDLFDKSYNDFIKRQALKLHTSFKQGLEYIGIRIPAQSMQSFMNLKVVAFTPEDVNIAYIPSDIILYQGSDFDIDKLYMMGASINRQGIYDSWSPFFNYSSTDLLKLSHKLPIPNKVTLSLDENGLDIDTLIDEIDISRLTDPLSDNKESLEKFILLLKAVNKHIENTGNTTISNKDNKEDVHAFVDLINTHNNYDLSFDQKINAIKNKIYGMSILIGNDVENQISQTTQMSANIAKTIAQTSASEIEHFSNNNNVSKLRAQHRTQVGRTGIGPNANGIKAFSALSTYFQNLYNNIDKLNDSLKIDIKGLNLKGDPLLKFDIPSVFNTNLNNIINDTFREELIKLKWKSENIPVDGFKLLSTLITAATDNAKDPILQGINCTPALNGMYIYLIATGANMYKIGEFFTSPFMLELSKHVEREFTKDETLNSNLRSAINYMFNGPKAADYNEKTINNNSDEDLYIEMDDLQEQGEIPKSNIGKYRLEAEQTYWENNIKNNPLFEEIFKNKDLVKNNLTSLLDATDELKALVKFLSIDGGVKNDVQEQFNYIDGIESFINKKYDRHNKDNTLKIDARFNFNEFMSNPEFTDKQIKNYESVKNTFNILDVINKVPHIKAMLKAMIDAKTVADSNSIKSSMSTRLLKEIKYGVYPAKKMPSNVLNKVYKYLDQVITHKFLKDNLKTFTINHVSDYYNCDLLLEEGMNQSSMELDFDNYADIMTYKHWFEQSFIPALKNSNDFGKNNFVNNLINTSIFNNTRTEKISIVTLNVDMSLLKSEGNRDKYLEYIHEFANIQDKEFPQMLSEGVTIGDAFVLYNLITNQNRVGKYSFNDILQTYTKEDSMLNRFFQFELNLKSEGLKSGIDYDLNDLYIRFSDPYKPVKDFTKSFNNSKNRYEIKFKKNGENKLIKQISNDDSLEMLFLTKNTKVYKDSEYDKLYSNVAEAIKQKKLIIEFRCD